MLQKYVVQSTKSLDNCKTSESYFSYFRTEGITMVLSTGTKLLQWELLKSIREFRKSSSSYNSTTKFKISFLLLLTCLGGSFFFLT